MGKDRSRRKRGFVAGLLTVCICLIVSASAFNLAKVVRVVDGDTIKVDIEGSIETVRMVGVDTAESVHPTKPVTSEGLIASAYTKKQLEGKMVLLVYSDPQKDWYGRYLAYVYMIEVGSYPAELICFNEQLILEGYSDVYTKYNFLFREEFKLRFNSVQ